MKRRNPFFLITCFCFFSLLLTSSCSKSKKEAPREGARSEAGLQEQRPMTAYFEDDLYPVRIDYMPRLQFVVSGGNRCIKGQNSCHYTHDYIGVGLNLHPLPSSEGWGHATQLLFDLQFFSNEGDFRDYLDTLGDEDLLLDSLKQRIVLLGNMPALPIKIKDGQTYILFTPNYYVALLVPGPNIEKNDSEEFSQEDADRVSDITKQMLERLQWLKPIDVNSQEFKDWKAHILGLIDEVNKKY